MTILFPKVLFFQYIKGSILKLFEIIIWIKTFLCKKFRNKIDST